MTSKDKKARKGFHVFLNSSAEQQVNTTGKEQKDSGTQIWKTKCQSKNEIEKKQKHNCKNGMASYIHANKKRRKSARREKIHQEKHDCR